MKTLLKIAWRNVWRNKARSIIIILAVAAGLWGGIFSTALFNGMLQQQFESTIKHQVSHLQIHHPDFIKEREVEFRVTSLDTLLEELNGNRNVYSYSNRALVAGMISTASMTAGIEIYGIDILKEANTTDLDKNIIEGDYFKSVSRNPVIIGAKLAEKRKINLGNRIILTMQDLNGDISVAAFRVCGIYRTSNSSNDERNVYVQKQDLEKLLGDSCVVNEIAVLINNIDSVDAYKSELQSMFANNTIRTWVEVAPSLSYMNEMSGTSMLILIIIILFALSFGLINTMLMTIFERTRELGVLMSVGMNKSKVFLMIIYETTFLVISGAILGSIGGALTVNLTHKTGIDLTSVGGEALAEWGMSAVIYPTLDSMFYVNLTFLVLLTSIISSIFPAYKALKLNPAEAVRKE